MAVQEILKLGHPLLRQVAERVTPDEWGSDSLAALIQDLTDTKRDADGSGLAAPQIGVSQQVAVIEFDRNQKRYKTDQSLPLTVFINPEVEVIDETPFGFWEGCLSVPGLRGYVERPRGIRVRYLDPAGQKQELEAFDFLSTVCQHELDHLWGRLYVDLLADSKKFAFCEEYEEFIES